MNWQVCSAIVVLCLMASGYQVLQYQRDRRWLARKAREIVSSVHAHSRETQIKALQDYIRHHVRSEGLSIEERPFLRATAKQALVTGQGFCGEATRAFIALARPLGIRAQRVNLHGRADHVVAETELAPGQWVLVDVQENPVTNAFLDGRWWNLDEATTGDGSLFAYHSNLNLRRLPVINLFVQRIKLNHGWVSWVLENPPLIKAHLFASLAVLLISLWMLDLVLLKVYSRRLGVIPAATGTAASRPV